MSQQVLLIENHDLHRSQSLLPHLQSQGRQVALAHNLESAIETAKNLWPNLIVFRPSNSHLQFSQFQEVLYQTELNIPCILIGSEADPLPPPETGTIVVDGSHRQDLHQTIEEVLLQQKDRFIRLPDLIIDCQEQQVLRHKQRHPLTPKEFKLLYLLISHQGDVLSRQTIMETVWETTYMGDTRTLDVHIRWLREKIEGNPSRPKRLLTVRGVGYRFIQGEIDE